MTAEQLSEIANVAFAEGPTVNGKYLHWDELRRRPPPEGLSREQWWLRLTIARQANTTVLPLRETSGRHFHFTTFGKLSRQLHLIDSQSAGRIEALPQGINRRTGQKYILSSLTDEAISSSLLEGAATTRQDAKRFIAQGRQPRTVAERMVINNYLTMRRICDLKDHDLSIELLLEIHKTVTEGTLTQPEQEGRIVQPGEERDISDLENNLIHQPPVPEELPARLQAMIEFANAGLAPGDGEDFLHPVIRSILLHFWLAYDHPFMDGNGRTARALFYWSMLRHGYWLFEYVSISELLLRSPTAYYKAFQYSEADAGDCSYFVVHQLDVICAALDAVGQHIVERQQELNELKQAVRSLQLNPRQQEALRWLIAHPGAELTFKTHQHKHGISYQTARTDMLNLVDLGLLLTSKSAKATIFYASADLEERLSGDQHAQRT